MGVIFSVAQVVRSAQRCWRGDDFSAIDDTKRIATAAGVGGLNALAFSGTCRVLVAVMRGTSSPILKDLMKMGLRHTTVLSGGVSVAFSAAFDLWEFHKGRISTEVLIRRSLRNSASVAAGAGATVGITALMTTAVATSWTGFGIIVLGGIVVSVVAGKIFDKVYEIVRARWVHSTSRRHALMLLGLPDELWVNNNLIQERFYSLARLIHGDRTTASEDHNRYFADVKLARDYLLKGRLPEGAELLWLSNK